MKKNPYIIVIAKILDIVSQFVKTLDEETINRLLSNELELKISVQSKTKKTASKKGKRIEIDDEKINIIISNLNNVNSREEAQEYLTKASLKKLELEAILKKLDVPFLKKDNMKVLSEKIEEATIGFKLRSKAIQGKD